MPPDGPVNSSHLQKVWQQEKLQSFEDFFRWYKNKHIVPTLEANKEMVEFHHIKGIDRLKFGSN